MLVLTRKPGQSIIIGEGIVVTVLDVKGDQVRLGINAPRDLPVHREEVYAMIKAENIAAARAEPGILEQLGEFLEETRSGKKDNAGDNSAREREPR